jgi:DNA repair photolyase
MGAMERQTGLLARGFRTRGISSRREGRFQTRTLERNRPGAEPDSWWSADVPDPAPATELFPDKSRTIITRNQSPDLPFDRSINPYKGCEHGCIYCYARQTHSYLDLSPGIDFETRIFYKTGVDQLLRDALEHPNYECRPIALGTNTDPYQPVEKQLGITRRILELMLEYRHPVTIVTKGALLARDLDLLRALAENQLVSIMVSITTLDVALKARLEPRAAAPAKRLQLVRTLADSDVPVGVMVAPVIPMLTDHELERLVAASADAGAKALGYVLIRLPYEVKDLFREWLDEHEPLKADRIMARIREMRGGRDYDAAFGRRQTGEGPFASLIKGRFDVAKRKYGLWDSQMPQLKTDRFRVPGRARQLELFD